MRYKDFHSIMRDHAKHRGAKTYIVSVDQEKSITFDRMNRDCSRVANFLRMKGVKKEDRISLIGNNAIETMVIFLGVLKYGAIINPVNFEESKENIRHIIKRVNPKYVFYDHRFDPVEARSSSRWIPFSDFEGKEGQGDDLFTLIEGCSPVFENPLGTQGDIAEIVFTSGTTEIPKGVVISREGLFYMVAEVIDKLKITPDDRILEYRAYNWASPQLLTILSSLVTGATLILARKFSRSRFPAWLKENSVTISSGVPTVFNFLVNDPVKLHKRDVPALKFMTSSSAPLSLERQRAFEKIYGIPINQMAGMSEAGWMIGNPPEKRKPGSVGTPFKYKEIHIVDAHGGPCKAGEEGEIVAKGKSTGMGYLNEKGGVDRFPAQGFPTGDLGYMDRDGYIFITGRKKDLIIRGGINISPLEITDRLMAHPDVREAATIGVPDDIYGEEVGCFIVPEAESTIDKQDIIDFCKKSLPDFKIPKVIHFVDELPKTKTGKVSKPALLDILREKNSEQHAVSGESIDAVPAVDDRE